MAEIIDAALDILHRTGPEFGGGSSNHGPMAVDAILAMGRPEAVLPWVEHYKRRLTEPPRASTPIASTQWREALGDAKRLADWIIFFDHALTAAPWPDVVQQWVPRFAPGVMTAAAHGLLRTSHAVRQLTQGVTPQRLHELATGLGYWAARYRLLPGSPSGTDAGWSPRTAFTHVPRFHQADFQPQGSIDKALRGLYDKPSFASVIDLIQTPDDLSLCLSELTELSAHLYLAHRHGLIAFVHAVTAPSALRLLLPYLTAADARLAARYAWQGCAAIYAWYATTPTPLPLEVARSDASPEVLIDRAIAARGAHTIKLTEACLREYALNPHDVYLQAAWDATERVGEA